MNKDKDSLPLTEILTSEQIGECSKAVLPCKDIQECITKTAKVLRKHEEHIMSKGYDSDHLSYIISAMLFPKLEKLREEGKIE